MTSGIYKVLNSVSGKFYIGSALNVEQRWRAHRSLLQQGTHYNDHLQAAWNKHGKDAFVFSIVEVVENCSLINEREQFWLDCTRCFDRTVGYNLCPMAYSKRGVKASEYTRALMSLVRKGRPFTENERLNKGFKKGNTYSKGKPLSAEHKAKLAVSNKGKPRPEDVKARISASNKGKVFTAEHRAKIKLSWIKRRQDKLDKQNADERLSPG